MHTTSFENELNLNGSLCWKSKGKSMLPLIKEGRDVLIIKKVPTESLSRFDVILFKRESADGNPLYVLHRILRVDKDNVFWVVGDNCTKGEKVSSEQILGRLEEVIRDGKNQIERSSFKYKCYLFIWCYLYPLRIGVLATKRFIFAVLYKIACVIGLRG